MSAQGDDDEREPPAVLQALKRWRALIVLVPLGAGLAVAAAIGARMLWAEVPERAGPGPDVTCWDLSVAPAAECPELSEVEGLRWAFPSFQPRSQDCAEVPDEDGPLQWRCRARLDGEGVQLTYSIRPSLDQGLAFLRQRYGAEPEEVADGERLLFRLDERTDSGYVLAVAYARHPLVVTVTAPTIGLRDRALEQLVEFRPEEQVLVRPRRSGLG